MSKSNNKIWYFRMYGIMLLVTLSMRMSYGGYYYDGIYKNSGKSFFAFLKREYDARSASMGGANIGMPNDLYGILSNPATVGFIDEMQAMISYTPILLDVRGGTLAFALPKDDRGVWAASIIYLSGGMFQPVDEYNNKIEGTLHPYWIAGNISWSKALLESFALGVTIKGIYVKLSEGIGDDIPKCSADGFASDIGVQYRTRSLQLIYGLLIRNLGFIRSSYSDDTEKTGLPLSIATGISYVFSNFPSVRIAFDLEKAIDNFLQYKLGLELNLYKKVFIVRCGYNFSQSDLEEFLAMIKNGSFDDEYQKTNWSLFSIGAGVNTETKEVNMNIDASLIFHVDRFDPEFAITILLGF